MYDTNSSLEHTIGQKNHTPKSANKFTADRIMWKITKPCSLKSQRLN